MSSNSSFSATSASPPQLVVLTGGFYALSSYSSNMDGDWSWDGKDNVEADLRLIMLPPTCEAGYFYPDGVYEVNHSRSLFFLYFYVPSQFYLPKTFPLCASPHFLPCFLFLFSSALVSWPLLLCPFSLFITRAR